MVGADTHRPTGFDRSNTRDLDCIYSGSYTDTGTDSAVRIEILCRCRDDFSHRIVNGWQSVPVHRSNIHRIPFSFLERLV